MPIRTPRARVSALRSALLVGVGFTIFAVPGVALAAALPTTPTFSASTPGLSTATAGTTLTVTQTGAYGIINWASFSVGSGYTVAFNNGSGATLNRVTSNGSAFASSIAGSITSTSGSVYLVNSNGISIAGSANISTGGNFIASTRNVSDSSFLAGGSMLFSGSTTSNAATTTASVSNAGSIKTGGDAILIGASATNTGTIQAGGTIGLIAGDSVTVTPGSGGSAAALSVTAATGNASNQGTLIGGLVDLMAPGGNVYAQAANTGVITATGTSTSDGKVLLTAGNNVSVAGVITTSHKNGGTNGSLTITAGNPINATPADPAPYDGGAVDIQGATISSGSVTISAGAPGLDVNGNIAGGSVTLEASTSISASGKGTAISISGTQFTNLAGSGVLSSGNGRWLVASSDPSKDNRGGLAYDFKQYSYIVGDAAAQSTGNGFLYTIQPTLNVGEPTGTATKTYDGTTDAPTSGLSLPVSGAIDGDTVSVAINHASYGSGDAGTGQTVTVDDFTLTPTNGAAKVYGYVTNVLDPSGSPTMTSGIINPAQLDIYAVTDTKTYDSTNVSQQTPTFTGLASTDTISGLTQYFTSVNVAGKNGSILAPDVVDASISTASGADYTQDYTVVLHNAVGTINPARLNIYAVSDTKTYDGTTDDSAQTPTIVGNVGVNDTVNNLTQSFNSAHVSQATSVVVNSNYQILDQQPGSSTVTDASGNYIVSLHSAPATITPQYLEIDATDDEKVYDGTNVSHAVPTVVAGGLIGSDTVTNLSQTFDTIGTDASQTIVASYTLNTQYQSDYAVTLVTGNGTIDPAPLTITAVSVTKVYDGNTNAPFPLVGKTRQKAIVTGLIGSDSVTGITQAFASKDVAGTGMSEIDITNYTVNDSTGGGDYNVTVVPAYGTITPAPLTVSLQGTASKTYDTTNSATLSASNFKYKGLKGGDDAHIDLTALTAIYGSVNAGKKITVTATGLALTGADAEDYSLASSTLTGAIGTITPAVITVSLVGSVEKTYNGYKGAPLTAANYSISGILPSDTSNVTVNLPSTGTFASAGSATVETDNVIVTSGVIKLSGPAAGDYKLSVPKPSAAIGTILPKLI